MMPCSSQIISVDSFQFVCFVEKVDLLWMVARSSSFSCKNFNIAQYSKSIKGINTKLGILANYDKVQLQGKWHNSKSYSFEVMPLLTKKISRMMAPDRQALVPHAVLLLFIK